MKKAKRINKIALIPLFIKYIFLFYILFLALLLRSIFFVYILVSIYTFYIFYMVHKYKNIRRAFQHVKSDLGLLIHIFKKNVSKKTFKYLQKITMFYRKEIVVIIFYIAIMLSVISWGLPSAAHPFPYYMDESHSLQAVKTVVKYGSSNLPHQEVGPMFNYIVSAVLVSPLFVFRIINPFEITTAISALVVQEQLYIALRAITLLFGVLALITSIKIARILKLSTLLTVSFIVATPVFLSISNYYKYDIALLFWILLSILLMLLYSIKQTKELFLLIGIFSALAVATKVTGVALLFLYIISFFIFTPKFKKKYLLLGQGILIYFTTFVLCGIPDVIFAGRSISEYLYYNIFSNPQNDRTFVFGVTRFYYVFFQLMPAIFGHFLFLVSALGVFYVVLKVVIYALKRRVADIKVELFLLITLFIFSVSLSPLYIIAANRALVLLPFFVFTVCIMVRDLFQHLSIYLKRVIIIILVFGLILQVVESFAWVALKYTAPPQAMASSWVLENIPKGTKIGIENIPVYQMLPDIVVREFYEDQYKVKKVYNYKYEIIDYKSQKLPNVVIVSNAQFEYNLRRTSIKKSLIARLYKEGYREIAGFSPKPELYKYFTNDINFVMVGMNAVPKRISVFVKD